MKFSVCIPNYNYGRYLGATIQSVLDQEGVDLEVCVSDNASTDDSVEVVRSIDDPRIRLRVNDENRGFAPNLDLAGSMATGDYMITLSSDDLMRPGALRAYERVLQDSPRGTIITCDLEIIDENDAVQGRLRAPTHGWQSGTDSREHAVSIKRADPGQVLRDSILGMRNPLYFSSTCFPRALYERLHGYGQQRIVNPDKWFAWRALAACDGDAVFIDEPYFCWRWHSSNQRSQEVESGALKLLVDDYTMTFTMPNDLLDRARLSVEDVQKAFVTHDVTRRGLAHLAEGQATMAARVARFGSAAFPTLCRSSAAWWALRLGAGVPIIGIGAARLARSSQARLAGPETPEGVWRPGV